MIFKFVVSDKTKSYQLEKETGIVIGKKIGDVFDGEAIGLNGYQLQITGGSDKDGFPMRPDIEGQLRKRIVVGPGIGFKGEKGQRKRKMLRGNMIAEDIVQINCKVVKKGDKPLEELVPKKEQASEEQKS